MIATANKKGGFTDSMDYGTRNVETGVIVRRYEETGLAEHVTREMGSQYEVVQVKRSISV